MGIVRSWGSIDESISSDIGISQVSDFSVSMVNLIPPAPFTESIATYLWTATNNVETIKCELYLWFLGLDPSTNPPQKMWTGTIRDFQLVGETICEIQFVDEGVCLDKYIGEEITTTDYPGCDPDDLGKIAPIGYGALKEVVCLAIDAGGATTLAADLSKTGTTITVSDASSFPSSGAFTVQVDKEKIRISSRTSTTMTVSARGYSSTTATEHKKGTSIYEVKTEYVYLALNHPVNSMAGVFVDGVRQTSGYTNYTGKSGDSHSTYPGKSIVSFSVKPSVEKQVNIILSTDEGSHTHTSSVVVVLMDLDSMVVNSGSWDSAGTSGDFGYPIDGSLQTYDKASVASNTSFYRIFPFSMSGIPKRARARVRDRDGTPGDDAEMYLYINGVQKDYTSWVTSSTQTTRSGSWVNIGTAWTDLNNSTSVKLISPPGQQVYEVWIEIEYDPSPPTAPATGVLTTVDSGNSSADIVVGSRVTVKVDGCIDNGAGSYTGTPYALISRPDQVIKHFLFTYMGMPSGNFITDADTFFGINSYAFSGIINEKKTARYWLASFAWQCRSYFRFANGKAVLTLRPDSLSSQKTITSSMVKMLPDYKSSVKVERSPLDEIINKIKLQYGRDWKTTSASPYRYLSVVSDATSITRYGEKERPELFFFDFVTTGAMALNIINFYLARYKDRKKIITVGVFLDNSEIEFADDITFAPQSNLLCEVQKANVNPGSGTKSENDTITLVLKEY